MKKRRREEVTSLREMWEKVNKHCGMKGLPPRGAVMSMEGYTTQWKIMTLIECRGCKYKGIKT